MLPSLPFTEEGRNFTFTDAIHFTFGHCYSSFVTLSASPASKHLFLLGVNAYNRKAYGLRLFADGCNVLELFVPVLRLFH